MGLEHEKGDLLHSPHLAAWTLARLSLCWLTLKLVSSLQSTMTPRCIVLCFILSSPGHISTSREGSTKLTSQRAEMKLDNGLPYRIYFHESSFALTNEGEYSRSVSRADLASLEVTCTRLCSTIDLHRGLCSVSCYIL